VFSNPLTSELERDYETPSPILLRKWPCFAQESLENLGLRLASKRGCVVKKHLQACLRVSYQQQIQHSRSESTLVFFSDFFIRVYPSHPWLKAILDFRCANDLVTRVLRFFTGNW